VRSTSEGQEHVDAAAIHERDVGKIDRQPGTMIPHGTQRTIQQLSTGIVIDLAGHLNRRTVVVTAHIQQQIHAVPPARRAVVHNAKPITAFRGVSRAVRDGSKARRGLAASLWPEPTSIASTGSVPVPAVDSNPEFQ
jgi:hypothetical protein